MFDEEFIDNAKEKGYIEREIKVKKMKVSVIDPLFYERIKEDIFGETIIKKTKMTKKS